MDEEISNKYQTPNFSDIGSPKDEMCKPSGFT